MPGAVAAVPKPGKLKKTGAPKVKAVVPTSAAAIPLEPTAALVEPYGEALMPRWRRPSLKTARYASPRVAPAPSPAMTFAAAPSTGLERRLVRYDLVALTDIPDEIQGAQVGQLQANDEVEITGRRGAWVQVRTPLGVEGWIHRTTLESQNEAPETTGSQPPTDLPAAPIAAMTSDPIEAELAGGAFAAAAAAAARERAAAQAASVISAAETDAKAGRRPHPGRPGKRNGGAPGGTRTHDL